MREPLDEKTMLEILELAKEAEQKARETSELATAIAFFPHIFDRDCKISIAVIISSSDYYRRN